MTLVSRIRDAGKVLFGRKKSYGINQAWLSGQFKGDVGARLGSDPLTNAYESCATAYACIDRISKDVAGVPLLFLSDPGDYQSKVADSDPVRQVFMRPMKGLTTRRMIGWSVMMRQLRGEMIWHVDLAGRRPRSIMPLNDPRDWVELVNDKGVYRWTRKLGEGRVETYDADEIIWSGQDNPSNPYRGVSPLRAAARSLDIDVYGRTLIADMIRRGGERGLVLSTDISLQDEQYDQLLQNLARRRPGSGKATNDMIFDNGLKLENPDLTKEDIDTLAWLNNAKDDICAVYGMAPVMIGDDDAAQYKSAPEAVKMYWQQTITPLIRSLEDAWDRYFVTDNGHRCYVRFDLSQVQALQEDEQEKISVARVAYDMGASFGAVNERYSLGFSDEAVSEADALGYLRVPTAAAEDGQTEPAKSIHKHRGLSNEIIRKRAADPVFRFARERRRANIERSTWNSYKRLAGEYREFTVAIARDVLGEYGITERAANEIARALYEKQSQFADDLVKATEPGHLEALKIGRASIQEIVDGKAMPWHDRVKLLSGITDADAVMSRRGSYIRENIATALIDQVNDAVRDLVATAGESGESVGWVTSRLGDVWAGWSRGHAATIARTEIGTMYNMGRVDEMYQQGFDHHEWLASIDEATRESHISANEEVRRVGYERFSNGLLYPQDPNGPADEVINCRCETIPVVKD